MAKLGISTGTTPNDGTGDSLLAGAVKVNSNFNEVYGIIGDGTNTFVGIVSSLAVSGPLSISTSYGAPTITGLANTAVISAETLNVTGVTTLSDSTVGLGNTFSSAGYFNPAGIVTTGSAVVNTSVVTAGVVTSSTLGVQVTGVVTATSFAVRGTGVDSWVGLNTVTLGTTGIAATAITITDTATLTNATITNLTATNVTGTAVTIGSAGIEVTGVGTFTGQIDANGGMSGDVTGNVTGNLTGTATTATVAINAQGLTGSPSILCGIITGTDLHATGGSGANISGVCTASSFSVGTNAVVTNARKLSNIASLDATTTATIEAAIEGGPNDFDDLNVAGLATVGQLYVNGRTNGLNIIGVCTGLSVPGISTLGIITGATSIQATDVYSNFVFGDGRNMTGVARTDNITSSGIATFSDAIYVSSAGVSTVSGVLNVGVATITDLTISGFATATTFNGQLDSGIGTITKARIGVGVTIDQKNIHTPTGIVTAATFDGNLTGTPTLGIGVTVTTWGLEVLGVTTSTTFKGNAVVGVATITTGTVTTLSGTTATIGAVSINNVGQVNSGVSTASSFVGPLTGNVTGEINSASFDTNSSGIVVTGVTTSTSAVVGSAVTSTSTGIVVGAGKSYTGDSSRVISGRWILGADSTSHYTFIGVGFTATASDPDLYLARGSTYEFVNANSTNAHPFRIQSTANGSTGAAYGSGVTNNDGAGGSTITFEVPFNAPDTLYYQCTAHTGMGGTIFVYPTLR